MLTYTARELTRLTVKPPQCVSVRFPSGIGPHVQFEREKYEQQGAGLGLIIAKRLTELNGGHFVIASTPGAETKVTVTFPALGAAQR